MLLQDERKFLDRPRCDKTTISHFPRALGKLRVALELAGAFVKVGGILIVPHGTSWEEEMKESSSALEILGLKLSRHEEYKLNSVKFWRSYFQDY